MHSQATIITHKHYLDTFSMQNFVKDTNLSKMFNLMTDAIAKNKKGSQIFIFLMFKIFNKKRHFSLKQKELNIKNVQMTRFLNLRPKIFIKKM